MKRVGNRAQPLLVVERRLRDDLECHQAQLRAHLDLRVLGRSRLAELGDEIADVLRHDRVGDARRRRRRERGVAQRAVLVSVCVGACTCV